MQKNVTSIVYRGRQIPLFFHPYNCGLADTPRTTERTIELALIDDFLTRHGDDAIELGAVSPYYFPGRIKEVVDPADKHELVSARVSLFNYEFKGRNIVSVSTIEHIGKDDYGGVSAHEDCTKALNLILGKSKSCLITFPVGYNQDLDEYVITTQFGPQVHVTGYFRSMLYNDWQEKHDIVHLRKYPYGPKWANAVIVIEK